MKTTIDLKLFKEALAMCGIKVDDPTDATLIKTLAVISKLEEVGNAFSLNDAHNIIFAAEAMVNPPIIESSNGVDIDERPTSPYPLDNSFPDGGPVMDVVRDGAPLQD